MIKKKKISMLLQIAILFIVGTIAVGALSSIMMYAFAYAYARTDQTFHADSAAEDLSGYIDSFPAHDWLFEYWYKHYAEMDIEYDAPYSGDTVTAQKTRILLERNPGFSPEYATARDVEALSEEDQKLYAEISYSRLITHIDGLKQAHEAAYVLGVVTEEPYDRLLLLFISAGPGDVRGDGPGQIYPIGKELTVTEERQAAIRDAVAGMPRLAYNEDEKFMDYYYAVGSFGAHEVLIGITDSYAAIEETIRGQTTILGTLAIIVLGLLAAVCLLMILFAVLRPLKKVQKSIRLYKQTKDAVTVTEKLSKIRSHNEIAELSGDVADLTKELDSYIMQNERITAEREHVRTELELASRIQAAMLPSAFPAYPDRKDFEIYASMTPAKEIGGDFYDFFLVDERRLCLVVADVSGKGIPAALFMMAAKITLSHLIKSGKSPAQALMAANDAICSNNPEEMFVTVWLGILDLDTGELKCANAGHEYPMLKKPGERFEMIRDEHGFVLGGMEGARYREYTLRMEPGASLFVYTDGLAEAVNPDNEMFGTERILAQLNSEPDSSPREILRGMKEASDAFVQGREPFDDLTMMSIRYHGPERQADS